MARAALDSLEGEVRRLEDRLGESEEPTAAPNGVTIEDLARRNGVDADVLVEFARAVGEVLGARDDDAAEVHVAPEAARRAALLALAEVAWEGELGPLLTSAEVRDMLDVSRQRVHELVGAHRLIALRERSGRLRFPVFQFRQGEPDAALAGAFWALAEHASDWTAASWCVTAEDALGGSTPAAWLRDGGDPQLVATLAARDAERLAH